jgi:hypothetical protein
MTDLNTILASDNSADVAAPHVDSFEGLAENLMTAYSAVIKAVSDFANVEDADVDTLQAALAVVATVGSEIGMDFALRGAVLAGELISPDEADAAGTSELVTA